MAARLAGASRCAARCLGAALRRGGGCAAPAPPGELAAWSATRSASSAAPPPVEARTPPAAPSGAAELCTFGPAAGARGVPPARCPADAPADEGLDAVLAAWWRAAATAPLVRAHLEQTLGVPAFFLRHERVFEQFKAWLGQRPGGRDELRPLLLAPPPSALSAVGARMADVAELGGPFFAAAGAFMEEEYGRHLAAFRRARRLADLQDPHTWFPAARQMRRRWLVHLGPTNSGKTHAATGRLLAAASGLYMSPLRLLAWEMYERMRRAGLRCALRTGQERLGPDDATHVACTIEMAPLNRRVAVAVVDEAQLVLDRVRGAAWTRALLGVQASELHACGAAEPPGLLELLHRLALDCGDEVSSETRRRLVPLAVEERPAAGTADLAPGDCFVCFTRRDIMQAKAELERLGRPPSVIYGALPPAVRREQAALFNDESSGRNILIASDAIGMGLNLDIRRVVFRTLRKFDGERTRQLHASEIRQIAGRAGRFGGRYADVGLAAALTPDDHAALREALCEPVTTDAARAGVFDSEGEALRAAVFPGPGQLESFSRALEEDVGRFLPFADLVERFLSLANVSPTYVTARADNVVELARALSEVRLPPAEKFAFCQTPVSPRDAAAVAALTDYARQYADAGLVTFSDVALGEAPGAATSRHIYELEALHKVCDVYAWLASRFPDAFADAGAADSARQRVSARISTLLLQPLAGGGEEKDHADVLSWDSLVDDVYLD